MLKCSKFKHFIIIIICCHHIFRAKKKQLLIYWSNPLRLLTLKINIINYISFNPTSILLLICPFIFYFLRVVFLSSACFLQLFHLQMIFTVFSLIHTYFLLHQIHNIQFQFESSVVSFRSLTTYLRYSGELGSLQSSRMR